MELSLYEQQSLAHIVKTDYLPKLKEHSDSASTELESDLLNERHAELTQMCNKVLED